ncbi:MAG: cysteine hydrolase family protein [Chloroflexota bacterium]
MGTEALLVIDMLNDFVLEGAPLEVPDTRIVLPVIRKEIEAARREGKPVLYICDAHTADDPEFSKFGWPPHAVEGTVGAQIVDDLRPLAGDMVIHKTTYSSFFGTTLHDTLRSLGMHCLRLTGCVTHICILFTASDAVLRDYSVTVIENGVAGLAREDHEAAIRIMRHVLGVRVVRNE